VSQVKWNVEHLEEVDSTNTWLGARAREGAPTGLVVFSDYQSAGRGRLDRAWRAPSGTSLLCSALLDLPVSSTPPQWLIVAAALSVCDALEELTESRPTLKWPNDVLYGELKVAGLLADVVDSSTPSRVVVGLGLNLTEVDSTLESATTVLAQTGEALAPAQVLRPYLDALARRRGGMDTPAGVATLSQEYSLALATLGRRVRVELAGDVVRGRAVGVDDQGALLVDTGESVRTFRAGDVVHVRREDEE
jgi:BirA family biotin operon repressor/biotin-[acetyl-CoA-carboxylase] ligase